MRPLSSSEQFDAYVAKQDPKSKIQIVYLMVDGIQHAANDDERKARIILTLGAEVPREEQTIRFPCVVCAADGLSRGDMDATWDAFMQYAHDSGDRRPPDFGLYVYFLMIVEDPFDHD